MTEVTLNPVSSTIPHYIQKSEFLTSISAAAQRVEASSATSSATSCLATHSL